MLTSVLCSTLTTSSFRAFCCLSGHAGCGPLGPSSTFPTYRLPTLPPHGCGTTQPLPTAQLSSLTLLVLTAQHTTLLTFPRTRLVPLLGQTALSQSDLLKLDFRSPCSHPWTANTKRDNCPFFQAWRTREAALAVPRGTE